MYRFEDLLRKNDAIDSAHPKKVGFIRSLYYYLINPYWEVFFSELGFELIYAECNRAELPNLTVTFENELCLPVKYFLAQGGALIDKGVDYIFAPLVSSPKPKVFSCPKVIMTGELLKLYFPKLNKSGMPRLLEPVLGTQYSGVARYDEYDAAAEGIGKYFRVPSPDIVVACARARAKQEEYETELIKTTRFYHDTETVAGRGKQILVLGHKYTVHNEVLNNGLLSEMRQLGVTPLAKEHLLPYGQSVATLPETGIDLDIFFSEGAELFRAAHTGAASPEIDGIIYLAMFNCGFDAIIEDVISKRILSDYSKPYLHLVLDDHASKANLLTKLEVFIDLVDGVNMAGADGC